MRVGLVYGHVSRNMGDAAINRGTVELRRAVDPCISLHVVTLNANRLVLQERMEDFSSLDGVSFHALETRTRRQIGGIAESEEYKRLIHYIEHPKDFAKETALDDCDVVLISSGDHFFSYADRPLDRDDLDLVWRVLPVLVAAASGQRVLALPVTIGPNEDPLMRRMLVCVFSLVDGYCVRDSDSVSFATVLLGGQAPRALLDPAFFLEASPSSRADRSLEQPPLGLVLRAENVGLRVGRSRSAAAIQAYREIGWARSQALAAGRYLTERFCREIGGNVFLLVQSSSADRDLTTALLDKLCERGFAERVSIREVSTVAEYLSALRSVTCVVSARLHSCILAILVGTSVFGVHFPQHGHKMPGIFRLLGIPERSVTIDDGDVADHLLPLLRSLAADGGLCEDLTRRVSVLREKTGEWLSEQLSAARRLAARSRTYELADQLRAVVNRIRVFDIGRQQTGGA